MSHSKTGRFLKRGKDETKTRGRYWIFNGKLEDLQGDVGCEKIYEEMLDAMGAESIQMGVRIGKGIENNFLIILRFVPISTSLRFLSKSSIFPPIKC